MQDVLLGMKTPFPCSSGHLSELGISVVVKVTEATVVELDVVVTTVLSVRGIFSVVVVEEVGGLLVVGASVVVVGASVVVVVVVVGASVVVVVGSSVVVVVVVMISLPH